MHVGDPHLGHGCVCGVQFTFHESCDAAIDKLPAHDCLGLEFSQLELRVLEVGNRFAKRLALRGVVHCPFNSRFGDGGRAYGLRQALLGQLGHHQLKALAFFTQHG